MGIKFSVIVVSYQAGDKLQKTIESIQCQTYNQYEIIVKDGGSSDGSIEGLAENSSLFIKVEEDTGIYDAMNQGVQYATGEYLLFLNCGDTFYSCDILEKVALQIEENPNRGIYYGEIYQEQSQSVEVMPRKITGFTCFRHMPCHQGMYYERSLLEEHIYNVDYRVRGDYDHFLWCYFRKGIRPFFLNQILSSYEGGGYSETLSNAERSREEHQRITEEYISPITLLCYRLCMVLTLSSVRKKMANNSRYANLYNGVKKVLYRRSK